ncbi:MAG TPA: AI-2E family transporter [Clostridiaceae bacterium]|nr:AI-2E family transporter [Clostridiaceae bacterium]
MRNISRKSMIKIALALIALLLLILVYHNRKVIGRLAHPFILSFFISYLLNPLVTMMERKGIKRSFGIMIIYMVFFILLLLVCAYMVPMLVRDMGKLTGAIPGYSTEFMDFFAYCEEKYQGMQLPKGIKNAIENNINRIQDYIISYIQLVTTFIMSVISKISTIMLIPILVYYFLRDFKNILEKLSKMIPRKYRNQTISVLSNVDGVLGNYVRSQIILSGVIGVMTTVALLILKINFALIIGIINGVTNIIPYFGPVIGAAPAVLVALLQSPGKALITIAVMILIQQIESDIICPKITSESVGLHPLTVIFALIAGGELFGITGLILGVPVLAALKVIYRDVMKSLF